MSRKKEIFKDATIYSLSSYVAQFLDVVNGILLRRFLGPASMGVWSFLQVILQYAKHAGLGVASATIRDVPYYLGKGDTGKAKEVQNIVFTFTSSTAVLGGIGLAIFAFVKRADYSPSIVVGLYVVAALIILQRFYNMLVVLLRAYKKFVFAGIVNILSSFVTLLMTVLLVWKFGLYGLFAGVVLHYVIMIALMFFKGHFSFSWDWNWEGLKPLLGLGSAMVIFGILRTVLLSIDRIMIAKYLGFKELGYYSIALMANNYLYALPNMFGVIFFPHFQEVFAQRDAAQDLRKFLVQPTMSIAYFYPVLVGMVWIVSDWLIPFILPQYIAGLTALKIVIAGSFFMAISHSFTSYVITVRKHWHLIPLQAGCVGIGFGATWWLIQAGFGIEGAAFGMALIFVTNFLALLAVAIPAFENTKQFALFLLKLFSLFALFTGMLLLLDLLTASFHTSFLSMVLRLLLFAGLMLPFFFLAEKEMGIWSMVKNVLYGLMVKLKLGKSKTP